MGPTIEVVCLSFYSPNQRFDYCIIYYFNKILWFSQSVVIYWGRGKKYWGRENGWVNGSSVESIYYIPV